MAFTKDNSISLLLVVRGTTGAAQVERLLAKIPRVSITVTISKTPQEIKQYLLYNQPTAILIVANNSQVFDDLVTAKNQNVANAPILIVTSESDPDLCRYISEGAQDYLPLSSLSADNLHRAIILACERQKNLLHPKRDTDSHHLFSSPSDSALKESEQRYHSVVETMIDGVITIDNRGTILDINSAASAIFQYNKNDVIGKNVRMLMPRSEATHHDKYLSNFLRTGKAKIIGIGREVIGLRKDGTQFEMELGISEMNTSEGQYFVGLCRDISDRKVAERKVLHSSKLATIGEMAAGLVHELSQPLYVMKLLSETAQFSLKKGEINITEQIDFIKKLDQQCNRMANIFQLMRTFTNKIDTTEDLFSLDMVVGKACDMVRHLFKNEGITVSNQSITKGFVIKGHSGQLEQVIVNFLNNSRDAILERQAGFNGSNSTPSTNMIKIVDCDCRQPGHVSFAVEDDGGGIAKEAIEVIFNPFVAFKKKGTGLGLSVSQSFLHNMGGVVTAENIIGGARFTITLPLEHVGENRAQKIGQDVGQDVGHTQDGAPNLSKQKPSVLLVDDEPLVLETLSNIYSSQGFVVACAENGVEALRKFRDQSIDLVVTDIRMPMSNGFDLIEQLRTADPALPIIIVSGDLNAESEMRTRLSLQTVVFLNKPVSAEKILSITRVILNNYEKTGSLVH